MVNIMDIVHASILGLVEGITEFLPISSTAHLEITSQILKLPQTEFLKTFTIAIQLGAIAALLFVFPKRIFVTPKLWVRVLSGFIPTGIIGFILYKIIKKYFLGNIVLVAIMLVFGGLLFLLLESTLMKKKRMVKPWTLDSLPIGEWVKLGVVQSLAVVPGVSRSGAIISYGLARGIERAVIVESAFLLAFPTMFAATVYDIYKNGFSFTSDQWVLVGVASLVAFISAFIAAKWLLQYVAKHDFTIFAWYRILLGFVLIFWLYF